MQAAQQAFETWKRTTVEQRASLIHTVAGILRERKFEFDAWLVFEVGKNWAEADADIAEAIDFCEFYAREALRLAQAEDADAVAGRGRPADLHSAGRGRGDSAVEFPAAPSWPA